MPVVDPTIDSGDPGGELMQNPPQAGPPQTRSVVGPDGSLYVAGPYSQYNADPTQIPAVNAKPPIYPPGYQAWQPPPPPDPEEVAIQQQQKMLAEGPLNAQTIQQSMQAAKAAQRFMAQRGLQRDLESGKDQAEAYRRWLPQILRDDPKALASFGAQVIKPQPAPKNLTPTWVPANPATGEPGHFISASGGVHTVATHPDKVISPVNEFHMLELRQKALQPTLDLKLSKRATDAEKEAYNKTKSEFEDNAKRMGEIIQSARPNRVSAPPGSQTVPEPVPEKKSDLKEGHIYKTARGAAKWNGEHFVKE